MCLSVYALAGRKAFEVYKKTLTPLPPTFPCEEDKIMKKHEHGMSEAIEIFRKETLMDSDVEHFRANLKEFTVMDYFSYPNIIKLLQ